MSGNTWTAERIARLGFLIGIGWDGVRISEYFGTTPNNVFRQANRFDLSFRVASAMRNKDVFVDAGLKRGITAEQLVERLLAEIGTDPVLIDNILDDDEERAA